jgi:hypothetical protein
MLTGMRLMREGKSEHKSKNLPSGRIKAKDRDTNAESISKAIRAPKMPIKACL